MLVGNRELLAAAEAWHEEGLLQEGAIDTLRARLQRVSTSWGQQLLAGLAGVLLAAALVTLLLVNDADAGGVAIFLALASLACAGGGYAVGRTKWAGYVDAFWLAALSLGGTSMVVSTQDFTAPATSMLAVAVFAGAHAIWWTGHRSGIAAIGAAITSLVALPMAIEVSILRDDSGAIAWAVIAFVMLLLWVAAGRLLDKPWRHRVNGLATMAYTVPFVVMLFEVSERPVVDGFAELALGGVMLLLILAASFLRERGVLVGAVLVLAVDAIVYAFDVGGATVGVIVLVATAVGLLFQAGALRRYLSD